jgi:hypothetical protein
VHLHAGHLWLAVPVTFERLAPPLLGDERATLRAFLDFHRATLALKCDGLTDDQLRRQASPPSTLSLLGLVRHMTEVERTWFRKVIKGEQVGLAYSDAGDEQAAESLDVTAYQPRWEEEVSLRLVMHHMIHEYARHNGHADLLREAIDGTVGV